MQKQLGVVDTKLVDVESGLPEVHWSVVKDIDNEQTKGEKDQRSYMRRVVCSKSSLLLVLLFLLAFSSYLAGQTPKHASRSVVVESHSEDWSDSADSIAQQSIVNNEIVGSIEEPTENANVVDETRDDDSINDSASQYSFYFMLNPQLEEAKVKSVEATDRLNKYVDYLNEPLQDDEFATLKSLIIAKAKANKVLLVIWLRTMGVAENKIAELEKYPESEMSDDTVYRVIRVSPAFLTFSFRSNVMLTIQTCLHTIVTRLSGNVGHYKYRSNFSVACEESLEIQEVLGIN